MSGSNASSFLQQPSPPPTTVFDVFRTPSPGKRRKRKVSLTAKQIFQSPKALLKREDTGLSDDDKCDPTSPIIKQLMRQNPPLDTLSISKRTNVPSSNEYREKLGTVVFKVKPVKHSPRKRHIVLRTNSMEEKLFHNVNKPRKKDGRTPLFLAAMRGDLNEIKLLYKFGADINQRVQGYHSWDHGKSPLYIAAENGRLETGSAAAYQMKRHAGLW